MSIYKTRLNEQSTLRLAESFGVAAKDATRFGRWHKGLSLATGCFSVVAGTCALAASGGALGWGLGATAVTGLTGHLAVRNLLPRAFSRRDSSPPTLDA